MAKRTPKHLAVIARPLRELAVEITSLVPDGSNARVHDERNIATIAGSLKRFGQRTPIVVEKKTRIVRAGNGRLAAARTLGWTHMAAVFVDEAPAEAAAFGIADNRSSELARWDRSALATIAATLSDEQMAATGFTREDVEQAAKDLKTPAKTTKATLEYRVIVRCKDEQDQAGIMQRLASEGYECQLLMS